MQHSALLEEEFQKFASEFDQIAKDQFQGPKLDTLAKGFICRHRKEIEQAPFYVTSNFPDQSQDGTIEEDLRIILEENLQLFGCDGRPSKLNEIVGGIYWRAGCASYLRVTLNKSRLNRDDDRAEAVNLCRFALRHTPDEMFTNFWYMICLGYQLKGISGIRDRMKVVRLFRAAALRCVSLDPKSPFGHHLLGRYYLEVGSLSWLQRTVAENFMGAKLDGSLADAEREFLLAHELKGDWLPTGLFMAQTLMAMKRPRGEIRKWLEFGLKLAPTEPTGELERRELLELDANLKEKPN